MTLINSLVALRLSEDHSVVIYRQIAWVDPVTLVALAYDHALNEDFIAIFKLDSGTMQIIDRKEARIVNGTRSILRLHHNLHLGVVIVETADGRIGEG